MQANFDEARQSQLPALALLISMGYTYLPREEVLRQRGNDPSKFLLSEIAFTSLSEINSFEYKGQVHPFSDKNILATIDELENIPLEGLQDTAKKVYHMIMTNGGKTLRETIGGKTSSHNFRFIDFEHPENNAFHVTAEYEAKGKEHDIRPDIVCFVNGIPFSVIENKKSGTDVKDALDQMNRNQLPDRCPKLFVYPQILIGTNVAECLYGTTGTPNKFYASWREKWDYEEWKEQEEQFAREVQSLIRKPIPDPLYSQICTDLNGATMNHKQLIEREITEQDRGLCGIMQPERLLALCRSYILFDAGKKKISRYQQFFAVEKMQRWVEKEVEGADGPRREGGIVWHTQGSGKSLTMVMFVKALIENPHLINPRVIVVTDRIDLDKQISETFRNCNLKKKVIRTTSSKGLLKLI